MVRLWRDRQFFFVAALWAVRQWKAVSRTGCKTKKLPRSKPFLSMALKHGLLEGSTFLFQYSSMTRAPLESCRLAEFKYAIFSRTGCKTKKLPRSKPFLSMALKHGLQDGSTFQFQYSSMTRAPLESCQLGELIYAISPG